MSGWTWSGCTGRKVASWVIGWVGRLVVLGVDKAVVIPEHLRRFVFHGATPEADFDPAPPSPKSQTNSFSFSLLYPTHTSLFPLPAAFDLHPTFNCDCCCFSNANIGVSVLSFAPEVTPVDPEKRSLNAFLPPPRVEAAEPKRRIPNVEGMDLPELGTRREREEPPVAVEEGDGSKANRSGLSYVGFGFSGGGTRRRGKYWRVSGGCGGV